VRERFARVAWLLIGVCVATCVVSISGLSVALVAAPQVSQFVPFSNEPRNILEGNWQSCREPDGQYGERVYDHVTGPGGVFELHMGPRREFALFKGVQDAHRDHDSPENLLKPYRVPLESGRAKQRWEVPSMNLVLTATLAGGSRTDCESWFIVLTPLEKTSH
jgi:hypothetical protein